jgi:hypothetical protein
VFLRSLPCPSADGVYVFHAVILVHIPHVLVMVLYYRRFQSVSMLITRIALCWWMVQVRQHVYLSFVLPNHGSQVTPHPNPYVTPCQFHSLAKLL